MNPSFAGRFYVQGQKHLKAMKDGVPWDLVDEAKPAVWCGVLYVLISEYMSY